MPEYRNSPEFRSPTLDPARRLPQGRDYRPHDPDDVSHVRGWLAHVEAGRIGNNPPTDPKIAAKRARNEEILRGYFCR